MRAAPLPLLVASALAGCPRDEAELEAVLGAVIAGTATPRQADAYLRHLADRAPHAGPQHEDLFRARSPDGWTIDLSQVERIRERAAVPEAVRGPDGVVRLLFVEGDHDRVRGMLRDGGAWMRVHGLLGYGALDQLVLRPGAAPALEPAFGIEGLVAGMVVDPSVVPAPDGGWQMFYVGLPVDALLDHDAWADGADHPVRRAESRDLVRWRDTGVAVEGPNADPAVWCDGAWCLMISTGLDRSVSTDGGRTFTFEGALDIPGFAPAFVELPDGRLRLFYNAKERGGPLRSLISADRGRTWQAEPGDRVAPYLLEAPSFLPDPAGGWDVFFHYWRDGLSGDSWIDGFRRNPSPPPRPEVTAPAPAVPPGP